jgi:hypothetical protein
MAFGPDTEGVGKMQKVGAKTRVLFNISKQLLIVHILHVGSIKKLTDIAGHRWKPVNELGYFILKILLRFHLFEPPLFSSYNNDKSPRWLIQYLFKLEHKIVRTFEVDGDD